MQTPKRMSRIPAYDLLRDMADALQSMTYKRQIVTEEYTGYELQRVPTEHQTAAVKLQFAQINLNLMQELTGPALQFVVRNVLANMKAYNLLWYWPTPKKNSQQKIILKELCDKNILFRTEVTGMYVVNPTKMWRGSIHACVEETKDLLARNGKRPSLEMIRDLKPKKLYRVSNEDMFNRLNNNNSQNLLT